MKIKTKQEKRLEFVGKSHHFWDAGKPIALFNIHLVQIG